MPPPKHRQTTQKHNNAFGPIHRTGRGTKIFYVKELILQDYSLTKITSKDSAIHHNNIDTVYVATWQIYPTVHKQNMTNIDCQTFSM